jgi:hypothetical protein
MRDLGLITCLGIETLSLACHPAREQRSETVTRAVTSEGLRFEISFGANVGSEPLDGRLLLFIATTPARGATPSPLAEPDMFAVLPPDPDEPRFRISDHADSQQVFGVDVDRLSPGASAVIDASADGYPLDTLPRLPAGDYEVQALLNVYDTFRRADGHMVKLPMDRGEGQDLNVKPGNLVSRPRRVHLDPASGGVIRLELTQKLPPVRLPEDTPFLKHVRIQSKLLTEFWGRPMQLEAAVLLPDGWAAHPKARHPLVVRHWHFQRDFALPVRFRTSPPGKNLTGYERLAAEAGYQLYRDWTSGRLPRAIVLMIQDPTPYFDDSYAVNSANVGPYGDAITQELIPYVEREFRAIGQPWARAVTGHSTGGWSSAALQIFYPDFFNGAWSFCPDPLDFRALQIVDLYDDANALWVEGPFERMPRPGERRTDGAILSTMDRQVHRELVTGTRGRSAGQWNVWQAVFGPVGPDGYPKPIWDPRTGAIDHQVALYWRDHYDLRHILERDWPALGPKLVGKLHFWVGTADNFYLDNGVRLLQAFMEQTKNPHYVADFHYGAGKPHCYFGDPDAPVTLDQLRYFQRTLKEMVAWMERTAPRGADRSSWKY